MATPQKLLEQNFRTAVEVIGNLEMAKALRDRKIANQRQVLARQIVTIKSLRKMLDTAMKELHVLKGGAPPAP